MAGVRVRSQHVKVGVCLLFIWLASCCLPRVARAQSPFELSEAPGEPGVIVYPAAQPGARSMTIVLHGMCSEPGNACRHFASHVTQDEHLICPRASRRCAAGGSIWPAIGFVEQVEHAIERASSALDGRVDESRGRTLIGYSLGAFRALTLAESGAQRYPRVMLIGAKIQPRLPRLRQAGVQRLLLSAGAWDMMHDHMQREARRLARHGYSAHFLDLGPVGHLFAPSFQRYLPHALDWLDGVDPGAS